MAGQGVPFDSPCSQAGNIGRAVAPAEHRSGKPGRWSRPTYLDRATAMPAFGGKNRLFPHVLLARPGNGVWL